MEPADAVEHSYQAALRLLGYRSRSVAEVRQRLLRRGFPVVAVAETIERLQAQGLLDDEAFARFWRQSRETSSPRSGWLVERELRQKGVAPETVAEALMGMDEVAAARRAAATQARRLASLDEETRRRRLAQFLRRRGFGWGVIRQVVAEMERR